MMRIVPHPRSVAYGGLALRDATLRAAPQGEAAPKNEGFPHPGGEHPSTSAPHAEEARRAVSKHERAALATNGQFIPNLRHERGMASLEFAIVAPFMLLLAFGFFELGRMLFDYQAITSGVRSAARYLSRVPLECTDTSPINAAPKETARNIAYTGTHDGSGTPVVGYWNGGDPAQLAIDITCTPPYAFVNCPICNTPALCPDPGRTVPLCAQIKVTATVPFPLLTGLNLGFGPSITLTSEHKEVNFGG